MQAQDTTTVYLLKLWPWLEQNKKSLIAAAAIVAILGFFFWYASVQSSQKQINAGNAVSLLLVSPGGQSAQAFIKAAADYPGTIAGQRAALQGAAMLFDSGDYAGAQTQYQQFINANPGSQFFSQALFGNAACLESLGQSDAAITAYKRVLSSSSSPPEVDAAKFAIAGLEESAGHVNDAIVYYEDVATAESITSLGAEARQRLIELRSQMPQPTSPSATLLPASPPAMPQPAH
ncbi:MAG: tetratricopeptide repeat protein [Limisphaerales bacterium]